MYAPILFKQLWGPVILNDVEAAYAAVGPLIAAFERTSLFGQFSSQYDLCLLAGGSMHDCTQAIGMIAVKTGKRFFTKEAWKGLQLSMGGNDSEVIQERVEGGGGLAAGLAQFPGHLAGSRRLGVGLLPPA